MRDRDRNIEREREVLSKIGGIVRLMRRSHIDFLKGEKMRLQRWRGGILPGSSSQLLYRLKECHGGVVSRRMT